MIAAMFSLIFNRSLVSVHFCHSEYVLDAYMYTAMLLSEFDVCVFSLASACWMLTCSEYVLP